MKKKYFYSMLFTLIVLFIIQGCKQSEWLDEKRDKEQVRPETAKDFQAILDNTEWINGRFINTGIATSNNVYIQDKDFASVSPLERQIYLWSMNPWDNANGSSGEWDWMYATIEYANIVLDGIEEAKISGEEIENIKGQAYFYRAIALYNLASLFCKQYTELTAGNEKGLPIRLTSDVNAIAQRSSLKTTMDQIISDCKTAITKLKVQQTVITRPGQAAAYALLSKILLNNGDYAAALENAEHSLSKKSNILDFNSGTVSLNQTYRFPAKGVGNEEIIFFAYSGMNGIIRPTTNTRGTVDTALMKMYDDNDLRKTFFYIKSGSTYKFRGNYTGNFQNFCGLATNEVYLIKAECQARASKTIDAMSTLNMLLKKRYKTGTFVDLTANSSDEALSLILQERRKELPFTGNIPWEDIRRLNLDPKRQVRLTRVINGQTYTLTPNSARYALPIPDFEIRLSGIEQNDY
ncbi:RagB/SusD family nutrient uptake outer membrane protein [Sphingobacterium sp. UME9]|uniref:RagB/SusD family nutrient uptake outer membrane protein n=1 Tax=Sphingobacterium TaxID=28453 RepID=UPI001602772A|nr:RagB/SusD family nutrient uptake outer membrane protein [Sphingobacterium sp. UME9]